MYDEEFEVHIKYDRERDVFWHPGCGMPFSAGRYTFYFGDKLAYEKQVDRAMQDILVEFDDGCWFVHGTGTPYRSIMIVQHGTMYADN